MGGSQSTQREAGQRVKKIVFWIRFSRYSIEVELFIDKEELTQLKATQHSVHNISTD